MQALLLDTHVWLWMLFHEQQKLSDKQWHTLAQHGERNALAVSEVSFWEVAVKAAKGRLDLPPSTSEWLKRAARTPGTGIIQVDRDVMVHSAELNLSTNDPADRMLVATALKYDLRLATADMRLLNYADKNRALSVLDCRVSSSA